MRGHHLAAAGLTAVVALAVLVVQPAPSSTPPAPAHQEQPTREIAATAPAVVRAPSSSRTPRPSRRAVYLTFDDGPSPYTRPVLTILTHHHATATFFQVGYRADADPAAARAVRRQGSTVGNHTHDHADLTRLSEAGIRREVQQAADVPCVRPPYGAVDPRVRRVLHALGKRTALWTTDPRDWSRPGAATIRRRALDGVHPGSIILLHDGGGDRSQTVAALPVLLDALHRRGYAVTALPGC